MNTSAIDLDTSKKGNFVESYLRMLKSTIGEVPDISGGYTHTFFQREAGPIWFMLPESIRVRKFKIGQVIRLEWEFMTGPIYYEVKIVKRGYKNNQLLVEII